MLYLNLESFDAYLWRNVLQVDNLQMQRNLFVNEPTLCAKGGKERPLRDRNPPMFKRDISLFYRREFAVDSSTFRWHYTKCLNNYKIQQKIFFAFLCHKSRHHWCIVTLCRAFRKGYFAFRKNRTRRLFLCTVFFGWPAVWSATRVACLRQQHGPLFPCS